MKNKQISIEAVYDLNPADPEKLLKIVKEKSTVEQDVSGDYNDYSVHEKIKIVH